MVNQLDFIIFFYGLAFILLGNVCLAVDEADRRRFHVVPLGYFALAHGAAEWLELAAMLGGDSAIFAASRTALTTASFALLLEFARQSALSAGRVVPGPWIHAALIVLVGGAGAVGGLRVANAVARYALALPGALAAAWVFSWHARQLPATAVRRFARLAALAFAIYAFLGGVVVAPAPFWPATVLNQDWFARLTGFPVQLARGVVATGLAYFVWAIWRYLKIEEVASRAYTAHLRGQAVRTVLALALILGSGWFATELLGRAFEARTESDAQGEIDLLAGRLDEETGLLDAVAAALAGSPAVRDYLESRDARARQAAQAALELDTRAAGAMAGYLVDDVGTIAAFAGRAGTPAPDSQDGGGLPFLHGRAASADARLFARRADSGERVYYASQPVRAESGRIVGVAALARSLAGFESDLRHFGHPYLLADADGIVMLTNRHEWLLRPLRPLGDQAKARLYPQIGSLVEQPLLQRELADGRWADVDGSRYFVRLRDSGQSRWSVALMMPGAGLMAGRAPGILLTLLFTIMALIYLYGHERVIRDRIEMERRRKLQDLASTLQVQVARDPLTGLGNRLKFDEAIALEIGRSRRYGTAFSLVMYDVDYFKIVNDTHGHQVGDKVLVELSRIVASRIRDVDLLVRWGGEEFMLLFRDCDGPLACQLAEKLRVAIEQASFDVAGTVTCSFGVAQYAPGDTAESIVARADVALYRAKIGGRNRVELERKAAASEQGAPSPP